MALVLPITFISGEAWSNMRKLISKYYQDIVLISISSAGKYGRNWSSDTSLSEIIVIAKKSKREVNSQTARYVSLNCRPETTNEAVEIAKEISRQSEDGNIKIGDSQAGWILTEEFAGVGQPSGILHGDLACFAKNVNLGKLVLPRLKTINIPVVPLEEIGQAGPHVLDISGYQADGKTVRGPFDIIKVNNRDLYGSVSYPVLWNHETDQERCLMVKPDSEGQVRKDMRDQALDVWNGYQSSQRLIAGATKLHINNTFSLMSQSLGACLTPCLTIGSDAWPSFSINLDQFEDYEKVVCLWLNTTLGLIGRWYISNRQQMGRSRLSVNSISTITTIDPRRLSKYQIKQIVDCFNRYSIKQLCSAYLADQDTTRRALDEEFLITILKLPKEILNPLSVIRNQWCSESSVRGNKKQSKSLLSK